MKAIIIINPGNPTGAIFEEPALKTLFEFAYNNNLVVLSDEVYQENIYTPKKKFISARKVLSKMDAAIRDSVEIISYHSCSKGLLGECGIRGGYAELHNFRPDVVAQYNKLRSISLCSNTMGQIMMDLKVRPPTLGTESDATVETYESEYSALLESLKRRADKCFDVLESTKGVSPLKPEGAMYAFPAIELPAKFIAEAEKKGIVPDLYYCSTLLRATGLVTVPGSGFKQKEGTWHFRTTFLPLPEERFSAAFDNFKKFHEKLLEEYA